MGPETDNFPFIAARFFRPFGPDRRPVRVIVIHTMEVPERDGIAKDIAIDFANRPETNKASAHLCIDNKAIFQCVKDNDIAFAAPGANQDGIQLELAGRAAQTATRRRSSASVRPAPSRRRSRSARGPSASRARRPPNRPASRGCGRRAGARRRTPPSRR